MSFIPVLIAKMASSCQILAEKQQGEKKLAICLLLLKADQFLQLSFFGHRSVCLKSHSFHFTLLAILNNEDSFCMSSYWHC